VPTVVLAVGAPYELCAIDPRIPFIASFGFSRASLETAVDVLFGQPLVAAPPSQSVDAHGKTVAAYRGGPMYA
jgi:hypothetical protein